MHYGSFIFGSLLMLLGLSILINVLFGIYIPIFRFVFGIFLIYAGISLISKTCLYKKGYNFYFSKNNNHHFNNNQYYNNFDANENSTSYQTIFSNQTIDLQTLAYSTNTSETVHIKTIFGTSHLYIDSNIPTQIITNTTFGNVFFPDHSSTHSGTFTYLTHNTQPKLIIYVTTVFGTSIIREK